MNGRNVITAIAVLACASAVCAVLIQRQRLTLLRAEQLQSPPTEHAPETTEAQAASGTQPNSQGDSSAELLRLRSQVTRLTARQRELAGVEAEAERLREQLAAANSNAATGYKLPPGYIRKSQAQFVGYSSPENTLQSFLWALQNHDLKNLLEALTPSAAQALQTQIERSGKTPEEFFKSTEMVPGMAIQNRQPAPDGSILVEVQVAPLASPGSSPGDIQPFRFRPINGDWKLDLPF